MNTGGRNALLVLALCALQCSQQGEGKATLGELVGNQTYPEVSAMELRGGMPATEVIVNLDDGSLRVSREDLTRQAPCVDGSTPGVGVPCSGLIYLTTKHATCTRAEAAEGRNLFTQARVTQYKMDKGPVMSSERRLDITIVWPHAVQTDDFSMPIVNDDVNVQQAVDYLHALLNRYYPAPQADAG